MPTGEGNRFCPLLANLIQFNRKARETEKKNVEMLKQKTKNKII